MSDFDKAYKKTLSAEGGYANNTADRGGETYKGITRKFYPNWMGWPIIDELKSSAKFPQNLKDSDLLEVLVEKFYRDEFWIKHRIALINSQEITEEVFDTAVNCGQKTAIQFLQEALNLCNQNEKLYQEITIDGSIGPNTAKTANAFPANRLNVLFGVMNLLQGERYLNICRKDSTQEAFLHGWVAHRIIVNPNQSIH